MKVAAGLQAAGFRVGLYTSPHISSYRERIRIDGSMIPEKTVERHLATLFSLAYETLSFFDLLTALAFLYFKEEAVDYAVVEVGLGGRLDATNVINPVLSVITSIAFDHQEILGDTLEKIAKEKEAIAKPGVPFIAGPRAAPFYPRAKPVLPVLGFYDKENSAIAEAALRQLGVGEAAIAAGIAVRPPCRFERVGEAILDVAHNPDGFRRLVEALQIHFPREKFHFIAAFSKDKEWQACLDLIRPHAEKISFVNTHSRFVPLGGGTVLEALQEPCSARPVICGSFYLMDEARRSIESLGSGAG